MQIIGNVRLAPGQVGFYDEHTRIHLTIANPEKPVFSNMNTSILKTAVRSGRLLLVGSLDAAEVVAPAEPVVAPVAPKDTVVTGVVDIPEKKQDSKEKAPEPEVAKEEVSEEAPEAVEPEEESKEEAKEETEEVKEDAEEEKPEAKATSTRKKK